MLETLLGALLAMAAPPAPAGPGAAPTFVPRTFEVGGATYPYQVFLPRGFDAARSWPVILYLHGAGESGTDGLRPTEVGLGRALRLDPGRVPAVVVFPQAPPRRVWMGDLARLALGALDRTMAEFHGDPERVYLAGLSLGGYGTWLLAYDHPERFAALVPVCGGIVPPSGRLPHEVPNTLRAADPYAATASRLKRIPAWVFHGAEDATVPVGESRRIVEALRAEGAPVRYTEYEGVGHNAWDRAFAERELWTWLLAQRRKR
jgi:predicted peptidase